MPPRRPLLSPAPTPPVELQPVSLPFFPGVGGNGDDEDGESGSRTWWSYLPTAVVIILILAPHPSLLIVLIDFHLNTLHDPLQFTIHLVMTYALTFMAFSSLIVCVTRDPGSVLPPDNTREDDLTVTESLLSPSDDDFLAPGKWCRKCWAPKPERTHHCSRCGRCVLKMDHHCPWMAGKCIGYRTYPAFVHFLLCVTLLALYIAITSICALWFAFHNPYSINENTPVHELFLAFDGLVFVIVIGSFLGYHLHLISTNQTTIESLSEFILLRHLPPLPKDNDNDDRGANPNSRNQNLSEPPLEHELSYRQRRLVRDAHRQIRIYDVGLRRNWAQVFGWSGRRALVQRILNGGSPRGDGKTFPRNPRSYEILARLAVELVELEKDR